MITVFQLSPNQDKDACAIPPYQCWKMSRFSILFFFQKNKNKSEKKADQLDFANSFTDLKENWQFQFTLVLYTFEN